MKRLVALLLIAVMLFSGMTIFAEDSKPCPKCKGKGEVQINCKKCYRGKHDGKCSWCYGTGWYKGEVGFQCNNCHGDGKCPNCAGTGKVTVQCKNCGGTGMVAKKVDATLPFIPTESGAPSACGFTLRQDRRVNITDEALARTQVYMHCGYLTEEDFTVSYDPQTETVTVSLSDTLLKNLAPGTYDMRVFLMGDIYNISLTV